MKTCKDCNECKPYSDFYKASNRSIDGYRNHCKDCHSKSNSDHYKLNKTKRSEQGHTWYLNNKTKKNSATKQWYASHPEARNYKSAMYRAKKAKATPKWLTIDQKKHIKAFYELAKELTAWGMGQVDVDHIIPLNGQDVCGLHVPWNLQVVSHEINCRKSNKNV